MKINELAKKTGLTAPTIRFYEKEGLLDARHVHRGENKYRDYCEEAVEHLLMIKEVQAAGFTLVEFKELDEACNAEDEPVTQKAATYLRRKIAEISEKRAELERVQTYLTRNRTRESDFPPLFPRASEVPTIVPCCFRLLFWQQERIALGRWAGTISREATFFWGWRPARVTGMTTRASDLLWRIRTKGVRSGCRHYGTLAC